MVFELNVPFGSYFSKQNWDTCSTNPWNCMNLHMNQMWSHAQVWPSMFYVPNYDFRGFTPYANNYSNSFFLDPMYALAQTNAQLLQTTGQGFGVFNGMGLSGQTGNWGGLGIGGWPWGQGVQQPAETSEEEELKKEQFNTLKELLNKLVKYEELDSTERSAIKAALSNVNKKKTYVEKYEVLEKAYKQIDKNTVKEYFKEQKYEDYNSKKDVVGEYYDKLLGAGFEYDSEVDNELLSLHEAINSVSAKDPNIVENDIIGNVHKENILDVISSWNSEYSDSTKATEKRVISFMVEKHNKLKQPKEKDTFKRTAIKPFVDAMIAKANEVKGDCSASGAKKIDDAVKALENAYSKDINKLSKAFDELYVLLRFASVSAISSDIEKKYGFVDSEVFNKKMFIAETEEDLKKEGFDNTSSAVESVTKPDDGKKPSKTTKPQTPEEKEEAFAESGAVNETDFEYEGHTIYEESESTGSRNYKRIFIVVNGEVTELENGLIKDNELQKIKGKTIEKTKTTAEAVEKAVEEKLEKLDEARKIKESKQERKDAYNAGRDVYDRVNGMNTNYTDYTQINQALSEVTEDTVIDFLDGFNSGKSWEGIIEYLDDEYDDGAISMDNKRHLIDTFIKKAKSLGLEDDTDLKNLENILKVFDEKSADKDWKNFDHDSNYGTWFGSWIRGRHTDNEKIDKAMKALLSKMKPARQEQEKKLNLNA